MATKGLSTVKYALDWDALHSVAMQEMKSGDKNLGLYIVFSLYTGLRANELLSLRLENVFDKGKVPDYLNIWQSKNKKWRKISVAQGLKDVLKHLDRRTGFILPGRGDEPMAQQWVNEKIKGLSSKYGIAMPSELSTHALRKTFARKIMDKNPGREEKMLVLLSEIFGHTSTAITRRYLGLRQEEIDLAYNCL